MQQIHFRGLPALRALIYLVGALTLVLLVGFQYLRSSLPQTSGRVVLRGLEHPVEVIRDTHGIPHIYARTLTDANFALGFVHAQDRLWQMEMNRRIAAGRLAELFGADALNMDRFLRTLGVHRSAEANYRHLDAPTRRLLDAYVAGVNAFLASNDKPLPPEFVLLGHRPEPWTPADSIAWVRMMAWDMSLNWRDELARLRLSRRLSPQQIAQFLPPYPGDPPQVLPDLSTRYAGLNELPTRLAAVLPPAPEFAVGSNNWVVAGPRSASGKPLLANDPHLGLTAPSVWYLAHLQVGTRPLIGATLAGVPMIILGRNERIAWGFTNTGPDVQDLYVEQVVASDPKSYLAPEGPRPFVTRVETLRVKGAPNVQLTVRETRHGPVISDVVPGGAPLPQGQVLSLAWTALRDDDRTMQALAKTALASDWPSFLDALRDFHSPQQNIVYADVEGNIGFVAPGRVPVRRPDNELKGLAPAPGWDARYDWQGFVPFDDLPRSFNPAQGAIATANNKIIPRDYRHWISANWAPPFRIHRIEALLAATARHSTRSFMSIQGDIRSLYLEEALPLILDAPPANDVCARAVDLLRRWNYDMRPDRPEPLIAVAWMRQLTRLVYEDELGDLFPAFWAERPVFMLNVLRDADGQSRWCDDINTPRRETCAELASRALNLALQDLQRRFGEDAAKWRWGDAHPAVSEHRPFTRQRLLAPWFDIAVPDAGGSWTVNVARFNIASDDAPYAATHGPTLRAIYDLAHLDRSLFIHSTGQSGNPFSPHYQDLVEAWAHVQYLPMTTVRQDIERAAAGRLMLLPENRKP